MLSHYTWGQFGLFVLVLLAFYYLGVAILYYREELGALLTPGKKGGDTRLAGASAASSPALVRTASAFQSAPPQPIDPAPTQPEPPTAGAAQNLPTPTALVVGGELPRSTATATGYDDSAATPSLPDEAALELATNEAQALDAERTEQEDHANEQLAALIRQKFLQAALDSGDATVAYQASPVEFAEPLLDFRKPLATKPASAPTKPEAAA